jgi:predicted acetyltransferase
MPELIKPTTRLRHAWLDARDDWGRGVYQDGAGAGPGDDPDTPAGFAAFVARLHAEEDVTRPVPAGRVHCTYRWMVERDRVLGAIALRHELNDFLLQRGGHVGYGVRPSERRRGLASWALGETLATAWGMGLQRVLICCDDGNVGSARTIERAGGVLENVLDLDGEAVRRYWIAR